MRISMVHEPMGRHTFVQVECTGGLDSACVFREFSPAAHPLFSQSHSCSNGGAVQDVKIQTENSLLLTTAQCWLCQQGYCAVLGAARCPLDWAGFDDLRPLEVCWQPELRPNILCVYASIILGRTASFSQHRNELELPFKLCGCLPNRLVDLIPCFSML